MAISSYFFQTIQMSASILSVVQIHKILFFFLERRGVAKNIEQFLTQNVHPLHKNLPGEPLDCQ